MANQLQQSLSMPIKMNMSKQSDRGKFIANMDNTKLKVKSSCSKSQENCFLLYEKGKIKNEYTRLVHQNTNKVRDQAELKECTFKPRINTKINRKLSLASIEGSFYDRAISWKKINQEK